MAHTVGQAAKAAVVAVKQVLSPRQRGPAVVHAFWQAELQPTPLAIVGSSQTACWFTHSAAHAMPAFPGAKQPANADQYADWQPSALAVHFFLAATAASMHAWVARVKVGSGGSVLVVVVGFGVVVVVVFRGFSVEVVTPGRPGSVLVVVVDVLVVGGRVVVVTVVFGAVVVVVVAIVPGSGHLTRQAVNAVLQAARSRFSWPVQPGTQAASTIAAQPCLHVVSAAAAAASHCTFFDTQLDPQLAPFPGAKQLPMAALYGVTQSASLHDL